MKSHSKPIAVKGKLSCKFCDYSINTWHRKKDGKLISNVSTLIDHVFINHEEEYEALSKKLIEEFGGWNYQGCSSNLNKGGE